MYNYRVSNVTHFGAFVDVGVGKVFQSPTSLVNILAHTQNGLIHTSKMGQSGGKLEVLLNLSREKLT